MGGPKPIPMPDIDEELLDYLEGLYPARCYNPMQEDLETHLRYAGKVDLITVLRASFEEQSEPVVTGEDIEGDDAS